ncbi:MAG TPA: hypothetical protein VFF60_09705 [Candidatus Binatus sp.]|nr:hypothetical protein [Candidatus Binatus sp.]
MAYRRVLASFGFCALLLTIGSVERSGAHPRSSVDTGTFALVISFTPGERFVEHANTVDRIDWKMPRERLEAFASQGMVINEEIRTTTVANARVLSVDAHSARISADALTTVHDVPRRNVVTTRSSGISAVTARNAQVGATRYALEDAPMVDLPAAPVRLGSTWTTRVPVTTTLGSGTVDFTHTVASIDRGVLRIDVDGSGQITGKEYNLPHLLPGSIALRGSAWFDTRDGLIIQESYRIDNTLVKPAGATQLGFVEHMDADTDVYVQR